MLPPTRDHFADEVTGYELVVVTATAAQMTPWNDLSKAMVIGRAADADIRLSDESVSRRHAILRTDGSSFTLEDLGSANGCRLHGQRLPSRSKTRLTPGDAIHIGGVVVFVRAVTNRAPASPTGDQPIVVSESMRRLYALTDPVARSRISVLVLGETGVGKDVFARGLHERSDRRDGPFIRVNCTTLATTLLESELFGHQKGAFTGATSDKPGLLEAASGGTVFLDEIGELSPAIQVKLLHVLETREVSRVGSVHPQAIDVRFIAATNRDLEADIATGTFRSDLYYRLAAFIARIPPLRERPTEIVSLAEELARRVARDLGQSTSPSIEADAANRLRSYRWPGNIRELRNVLERAVILAQGQPIGLEHLEVGEPAQDARQQEPHKASRASTDLTALSPTDLAERQQLIEALKATSGNQSEVARSLGISRTTLLKRLDALHIVRPRKRPRF